MDLSLSRVNRVSHSEDSSKLQFTPLFPIELVEFPNVVIIVHVGSAGRQAIIPVPNINKGKTLMRSAGNVGVNDCLRL